MSLEIVRADEWGMRPVDWSRADHRSVSAIVEGQVHHSAEKRPSTHAGCDDAVRGFDSYHRDHNGWLAIGYSRVICAHGFVYIGRPMDVVPAACLNHNTPILAYCLIADDEKATADQWAALTRMMARDARILGHALSITTHREFFATACPGNPIQAQVNTWRDNGGPKVKPSPTPIPSPTPTPMFPLAPHHYFGRPSPRPRCHSGYWSKKDRDRLSLWQLRMQHRGWEINVGGRFTVETLGVVRAFQEEKDLAVTGRINPATWRAAWTSPII